MSIDATASALAAHGVAFAPAISQAAKRHNVDPTLLAAVAAQETGGPGSNAGRNVVGDGGPAQRQRKRPRAFTHGISTRLSSSV